MDPIEQRLRLQIDLLRLYSRVLERPWGLLLYSAGNPTYYEANGARQIRTDQPEAVIAEIVSFYQNRRLTPRVIVDQRTQPADMRPRLERHGFVCGTSQFHLMMWDTGDRPEAPPAAIRVTRAARRDLAHIVAIQAEDDPWARPAWLRNRTDALLAASAVRIYLAWVGAVPAAMALVVQGQEAGLVESVITRPRYRRRGLASALIRRLQSTARTPLLLEVEDAALVGFYERLGFVTAAVCEEHQCWLPAE